MSAFVFHNCKGSNVSVRFNEIEPEKPIPKWWALIMTLTWSGTMLIMIWACNL